MSNPFQPTDETDLRMSCVELAGGDVFTARQILDFVTGATDQTPRQRIEAALKELEAAGVR